MIKIRQDWHPGHRVGGATLSHYLLNIMINMMMIDDHNNDDDDDDQHRMGTWDTGWGNLERPTILMMIIMMAI